MYTFLILLNESRLFVRSIVINESELLLTFEVH